MAARIALVPAEQAERQLRRRRSADGDLWALLDAVVDPEIPVLSLWELGVLRDVRREDGDVVVVVTPTYSGCPAFEAMIEAIRVVLAAAGHGRLRVDTQLAPAWTTAWLDDATREKLRCDGISPPAEAPQCPQCGSGDSRIISEFGSTACKALYRCRVCEETFHHLKRF